MPAVSKVQNLDEVISWLEEGRSYRWMVDEYQRKYGISTSPSMWAAIRRRRGLTTRLVRDQSLMPWRVNPEHRHAHAAAMLRAEARRRAGRALTPRTVALLEAWRARLALEGTVVLYDRNTPSGWRYVPRRPGVDLDLIRDPLAHSGDHNGDDVISSSVHVVYADGRSVPVDPELLP